MNRSTLLACMMLALSAVPAKAFDCARSSTATEKLICSDVVLKAADDEMGAAWSALVELVGKAAMRQLRINQRAWWKWRDGRCGDGSDAERVSCLKKLTGERTLLLSASSRTGPGTDSTMVPFALNQIGSKTRYAINIAGVRFSKPQRVGARAFNKVIDDAIAAAPVNEQIDFETFGQLSYNETITLEYAGPGLFSALSNVWRYDGGAHGNYYSTGLNFSPGTGELQFADIFPETALPELASACRERLGRADTNDVLSVDERREELFEDNVAVFAEQMKTSRSWSFDSDGAQVHFAPYAIAAYAAGAFECRLPLGLLASMAKNKTLLPE